MFVLKKCINAICYIWATKVWPGLPTIQEFIFQPFPPIPVSAHIQTNNNVCNSKLRDVKPGYPDYFTYNHQPVSVTHKVCQFRLQS